MASQDDTPAPQPPRFVPTLTEVIAAHGGTPEPPASLRPAPAFQPAADELLARLGPELDRQIAEAIGRVLHEQMLGLNARVQKAVAEVVREAVAQAMLKG